MPIKMEAHRAWGGPPARTADHDALRHLPRAVLGMIDLLPNIGEPFPLRQRLIWLRCMAGIFELVYDADGAADIRIEPQDP